MPRVVTVAQEKGGSAKSALAAEIAAQAARQGKRVLVIDCDSQRTCTNRLGFRDAATAERSVLDYIEGAATAAEIATASPTVPGVDVIQGADSVRNLDPELVTVMRDQLPDESDWDVIVIDTPGDLGYVTQAALAAADTVVHPVTCDGESWAGLRATHKYRAERVDRLRRKHGAQKTWYVPTRYVTGTNLAEETVTELARLYPGQVTSRVREGVDAKYAYLALMPVSVFSPTSNPGQDYAAAAAQILA